MDKPQKNRMQSERLVRENAAIGDQMMHPSDDTTQGIKRGPLGIVTPGVFDQMMSKLPPSPARRRFNESKQRIVDESVEFWKSALKYVKSGEYTPETYNARFGYVPFAWCRYMESIDGLCDECEFFGGEWCGHAPSVNKLQPEATYYVFTDEITDMRTVGMMPKEELAYNIKAFINGLKRIEW